ncbi:sporulation integral membrane protein YlbJ [Clostridium rectalis]|uniref:sporulation integral membrane protein YlbJ n=1 Tax=Clostridium rectalis TaxID=2040295 RepID=UPI000F62DFB7|nr:sporulation integral membrane protein YlbJ [Clostridium rectalis]
MNIFLCVIILILILFLLYIFKNKYLIITFICSLIILNFVFNPSICINGSISGATLFFNKVFPALFPFLIICNMMLYFNGVYIYSKIFGKTLCRPLGIPIECSFVIIISMLCGYPLGAKYSCDLYENKIIDYNTCERLLNIASSASPLFIIATIGTSMFQSTLIGYIILISNYLSCFFISLILPNRKHKFSIVCSAKNIIPEKINFGTALKNSIENSINTCLSVGGFITLFSVINNIIKNSILFNTILDKICVIFKIPKASVEGTFLGLVEMTNGCNIISSSNISIDIKIIVISFLLSFSGLCIIWQCSSFINKHNFSLFRYIKFKFIQGLICSFISYILYKVLFNKITTTTISYSMISNNININILFLILWLVLLIPIILYNIFLSIHFS